MGKEITCGQLRAVDVGKKVTLKGWVNRRRDHGGLIFIDLRDRWGLTQVVFNTDISAAAHEEASQVRNEFVLAVTGTVGHRPPGTENPNMATGEIEVVAEKVEILNPSKTPPFYINEDQEVDEMVRLKYRYLDLRRERMQQNIMLRHRVIKFIRDFLDKRDFLEIETPMLIKSTPEGARDYLVPSRLNAGDFYALPQSPQQLKQLLMVAGMERYFQIARCFRDEDLRADRQPEFTQLDLEMSFVDQDDILNLIDEMLIEMVPMVCDKQLMTVPFPRITYAESMQRFGNDKPDMRFGLELVNLSGIVSSSGFQVFRSAVESGGMVKGLRIPGAADYTRREVDELTHFVQRNGAKGLASIAVSTRDEDGNWVVRSSIAKFLQSDEINQIVDAMSGEAGDLLVFVADKTEVVNDALGRLRVEIGNRLGLTDRNVLAFVWVIDPPLLEWKPEENRWDAVHHPFTAPNDEDIPYLETDPAKVRAKAYDIVCNGYELCTGSIRIHRRELQQKIFELLGHSEKSIQERFGHLLTAFEYGAPPHGGVAPGIDRIVMLLAGEDSIREVIAFPKTQSAADVMLGAPSFVDEQQLRELHLCVIPEEKPDDKKVSPEPVEETAH